MALWLFDEEQSEPRRNREAIIGRMRLPVYDIQQGGAVTVDPKRVQTVLPLAATPLHVIVGFRTIVHSIELFNSDAVSRIVSLYLVNAAGAAGAANQVWAESLYPGERVVLTAPWMMAVGDTIVGNADANSVVSCNIDMTAFDAHPVGVTMLRIGGALIPNAAADYYTVPGAGVKHALLVSLTVCNPSGAAVVPTISRAPAGAVTLSHRILGESVDSKQTLIDDVPLVLIPGDRINMVASVNNVASLRATVLEFA